MKKSIGSLREKNTKAEDCREKSLSYSDVLLTQQLPRRVSDAEHKQKLSGTEGFESLNASCVVVCETEFASGLLMQYR